MSLPHAFVPSVMHVSSFEELSRCYCVGTRYTMSTCSSNLLAVRILLIATRTTRPPTRDLLRTPPAMDPQLGGPILFVWICAGKGRSFTKEGSKIFLLEAALASEGTHHMIMCSKAASRDCLCDMRDFRARRDIRTIQMMPQT